MQQNEKLKKEITRLQVSAKRTQTWSDKIEKTKNGVKISGLRPDKGYIGHKSAKMAKRSKVIELRRNREIEEKSKLLQNIDKQDELFINLKNINENSVIEMQNISIFYNNKSILKDFNIKVEPREKVAICGENGSGKTSLLKLILERR